MAEKVYFPSLTTEQNRIIQPDYLPTFDEVVGAFSDDQQIRTRDWMNFFGQRLHGYPVFWDFLTLEYVNDLTRYLNRRSPKHIVEVGAGRGKLGHFLKERLNGITYTMTDANILGLPKLFTEDEIDFRDYEDALAHYQPDFVLSSWMPFRSDWTSAIRNTASVQEYVLIGSPKDCGTAATWTKHPGFKRVDLPRVDMYHLCWGDYDPQLPDVSKTVSFRRK